MTEPPQDPSEAFRVAVDTRKFEIELFWKRSTFYCAFNAVSFGGFVALAREEEIGLSIVVPSFGLATAAGWALVNLGSKLWYENWEIKAKELEGYVADGLFSTVARKPKADDWPVRARRFSVSKITILISYYVVAIWLGALAFQTFDVFACAQLREDVLDVLEPAVGGATVLFLVVLAWLGRGSDSDS